MKAVTKRELEWQTLISDKTDSKDKIANGDKEQNDIFFLNDRVNLSGPVLILQEFFV